MDHSRKERPRVRVGYLTGADEARLTWFAAHRWHGFISTFRAFS